MGLALVGLGGIRCGMSRSCQFGLAGEVRVLDRRDVVGFGRLVRGSLGFGLVRNGQVRLGAVRFGVALLADIITTTGAPSLACHPDGCNGCEARHCWRVATGNSCR